MQVRHLLAVFLLASFPQISLNGFAQSPSEGNLPLVHKDFFSVVPTTFQPTGIFKLKGTYIKFQSDTYFICPTIESAKIYGISNRLLIGNLNLNGRVHENADHKRLMNATNCSILETPDSNSYLKILNETDKSDDRAYGNMKYYQIVGANTEIGFIPDLGERMALIFSDGEGNINPAKEFILSQDSTAANRSNRPSRNTYSSSPARYETYSFVCSIPCKTGGSALNGGEQPFTLQTSQTKSAKNVIIATGELEAQLTGRHSELCSSKNGYPTFFDRIECSLDY